VPHVLLHCYTDCYIAFCHVLQPTLTVEEIGLAVEVSGVQMCCVLFVFVARDGRPGMRC
jgi:hypothetical protein